MVSCNPDYSQILHVLKNNLEHLVFLPLSPKCWGFKHVSPCLLCGAGDWTQGLEHCRQELSWMKDVFSHPWQCLLLSLMTFFIYFASWLQFHLLLLLLFHPPTSPLPTTPTHLLPWATRKHGKPRWGRTKAPPHVSRLGEASHHGKQVPKRLLTYHVAQSRHSQSATAPSLNGSQIT